MYFCMSATKRLLKQMVRLIFTFSEKRGYKALCLCLQKDKTCSKLKFIFLVSVGF